MTNTERFTVEEQKAIFAVEAILERGLKNEPAFGVDGPEVAKRFLKCKLGGEAVEKFAVMFLDSSVKLIEFKILFTGTVGETSVYPREILRDVIRTNATAVIIAHNHPSGSIEPSTADKIMTNRVKEVLKMIDVDVLDHMIVGGSSVYSFAEHGQC